MEKWLFKRWESEDLRTTIEDYKMFNLIITLGCSNPFYRAAPSNNDDNRLGHYNTIILRLEDIKLIQVVPACDASLPANC